MVKSVPVSAKENAGISIDGYYDDWEGKPMTTLTWNSNNGVAKHDASMIKDDDYIYIYLEMHPSYHSTIPINAIYLSVNNQPCQLFFGYANSKNTVDWNHPVHLNKTGTYSNLHPFTSNPDSSLGDAVVNIYRGNERDKFEVRINIKELEKVMNLPEGTVNNGSQLQLSMPNVGRETIELVGTSTYASFGIALCVGCVIFANWYRSKRMRFR
jgi:hypothetical protein